MPVVTTAPKRSTMQVYRLAAAPTGRIRTRASRLPKLSGSGESPARESFTLLATTDCEEDAHDVRDNARRGTRGRRGRSGRDAARAERVLHPCVRRVRH